MPDDALSSVAAKLDTLIGLLTPPEPDVTSKEDARDISLAKGTAFFQTYLEKTLPKEKLDTLTFDELVLAAELKSQIQPPKLNPAPSEKTDAIADSRPTYLRPVVN